MISARGLAPALTVALSLLAPACAAAQNRVQDPALQAAMNRYYEGALFTDPKNEILPYRLFVPPTLETGNKYPLVLNLEGNGSQGNTLTQPPWRQWPVTFFNPRAQKENPCFVLTPRCLAGQTWAGYRPQTELTQSMRLTLALLDAVCKEQPIDVDRIYVRGFSMGGFGTWELIERFPDRFAAAIPISGGGDPSRAGKLTKLPIWAFHGGSDPTVPVSLTRSMIEAIKSAGGDPRYSEFPDTGHGECLGKMEQEKKLLPWLFSQRRGEADRYPR